jgi:hypothetical protein
VNADRCRHNALGPLDTSLVRAYVHATLCWNDLLPAARPTPKCGGATATAALASRRAARSTEADPASPSTWRQVLEAVRLVDVVVRSGVPGGTMATRTWTPFRRFGDYYDGA